MKRTFTKWITALATLLLLFAVGFMSVAGVVSDNAFLERQIVRQQLDEKLGISVPDLSLAVETLFDYMRGEREDIVVSVTVNGAELEDLYYHEKEVVHMEEVRTLWSTLRSVAWIGGIAGAVLFACAVLFSERETRFSALSGGIFLALLIFGLLMAFCGIWAAADFDSFWTVFHFLIFPDSLFTYLAAGATASALNSLNWVLSSDCQMIRILESMFPPMVLRVVLFVALELACVLLAAVILRIIDRRGTKKPVPSENAAVEQEREPILPPPDLLMEHRVMNTSVRERGKLKETAEAGRTDEPTETEGEA